mmetsp:Transcript_15933/g.34622  ORF Transcript_15933/g.34622 Transcript_15933/m.34622 type:complete len:358 (+) Transcript_15933:116-1189(+)
MAQHSFNSLQSSSQATLICYRGPGCATQYKFETSGTDLYGQAKTLADAQALASTDYRDQCKGFFIDDLSDTPFGNLSLGEGEDSSTGGFAEICSGLVPSGTYSDCKFDDHISMIHMTGPEGSLQVDMTSWLLFSVEPTCVSSVQVVDGSCTWYGTSVECAGTSATLGLVWNSEQRCCGQLGSDLAKSECTGAANALNADTCQNKGPPVGFETDPSCAKFDEFNSNVERMPIKNNPSILDFSGSCDRYVPGAAAAAAATAEEEDAAEDGKVTITIETEGDGATPGSVGLCGVCAAGEDCASGLICSSSNACDGGGLRCTSDATETNGAATAANDTSGSAHRLPTLAAAFVLPLFTTLF